MILFFWLIRASSWNQISIVAISTAFSRAISSASVLGSFFKIFDRTPRAGQGNGVDEPRSS